MNAMMMPRRPLGRDGPAVSVLGLGCMGTSDFYDATDARDDAESSRAIRRALQLRINMIDTRDVVRELGNHVRGMSAVRR